MQLRLGLLIIKMRKFVGSLPEVMCGIDLGQASGLPGKRVCSLAPS